MLRLHSQNWKTADPENAKLFLDDWRKLDVVVERVSGSKTAGKKRTRKRKNRK